MNQALDQPFFMYDPAHHFRDSDRFRVALPVSVATEWAWFDLFLPDDEQVVPVSHRIQLNVDGMPGDATANAWVIDGRDGRLMSPLTGVSPCPVRTEPTPADAPA